MTVNKKGDTIEKKRGDSIKHFFCGKLISK
jgi:hypothetical protein